MRKTYERPAVDIRKFGAENVVTTSVAGRFSGNSQETLQNSNYSVATVNFSTTF